jgi:hypothetical protein
MKKIIFISFFLALLFQVKSQNTEVEIYMMQSNTIVKGTVEASSSDSLRIRIDSLHTLVFAKTELEGLDLPVSKEVKKFRRRLIRNELRNENYGLFMIPGIYQMHHGEKVSGKIMFALASIGIIGAVATLVVFYVVIAANPGFLGLIIGLDNALFVLMPSLIISESSRIWSLNNKLHRIKKMVNSRYYYRGTINKIH